MSLNLLERKFFFLFSWFIFEWLQDWKDCYTSKNLKTQTLKNWLPFASYFMLLYLCNVEWKKINRFKQNDPLEQQQQQKSILINQQQQVLKQSHVALDNFLSTLNLFFFLCWLWCLKYNISIFESGLFVHAVNHLWRPVCLLAKVTQTSLGPWGKNRRTEKPRMALGQMAALWAAALGFLLRPVCYVFFFFFLNLFSFQENSFLIPHILLSVDDTLDTV